VSSDEQRERFLQRLVTELQKEDRGEMAVQVGKRLKDASNATLALLFGKVAWLLDKKQFAEAVQSVDESKIEEVIRQPLRRQILMMQYQETHDEAVAGQIAKSFSSHERIEITELNEEAKKIAQISNPVERLQLLWAIVQEQLQLIDLAGIRQTTQLISDQLDKETDPVQLIQHRLLLARLQSEMREHQKMKENLNKLMQMLLAITDLKVLKDLAPPQPPQAPTAPPNGATRLDLPGLDGISALDESADESAIRDQLFQVYLLTASLLAKAEAPAESKAAFEKAKEQARLDKNAARKSEKLLILAQFLADEQD